MTLLGAVAVGTPAGAQTAISCGTVITASTTLTNDVGPCTTDGIIIGADGVKLNLNGKKVYGAPGAGTQGGPAGQNVGIRFRNVSNAEVTNGEVTGFAAGVRIDGGSTNRVASVYSHDNIGPVGTNDNGDGISAFNSSYNTIENNRVVHNGPFSGIAFVTGLYFNPTDPPQFATGNKVLNNQVLDNNVALCGAGSAAVPGTCTTRDPNTGAFVTVPGSTTQLRVPRGQQISGSVDEGIRIEGPNVTYTVVDRNTVNGNGNNGIFVQPSCRNAFLRPVPPGFVRCVGDIGNIGTVITNNVANRNGYGRATGSGITLFAMMNGIIPGRQATVMGNTAQFNYSSGIELTGACGGEATDDPATCVTNNNNVVRNNASNNRLYGIIVGGRSTNNRIVQNTVNNNGISGISLQLIDNHDATPPIPIPGTGASNNILYANMGMGNAVFDGEDQTPGCDANIWMFNTFGKVNQPCVRGSGGGMAGAAEPSAALAGEKLATSGSGDSHTIDPAQVSRSAA